MSKLSKLMLFVLIGVSLLACGYVPGRQTYWDYEVKEMCQKDGGLKVFEVTEVSRAQYELFRVAPGPGSGYAIRPQEYSGSAPIVRRSVETTIRDWAPRVWRLEESAVRVSDQKVLATYVSYIRSGGDLPTGLFHESGFFCPRGSGLSLQEIVRVKD